MREGRELRHCVGTYVRRVANGTSRIVFVRRASAPDVPYCTVEISPDKDHTAMVQCYNAHDTHDGDPNRKRFIREWAKARGIDIRCAI